MKETVEMFCNRFAKIAEYMPMNMIQNEYGKEVKNLMDILDDLLLLRRRMSVSGSQSRITVTEVDCNFF